MTETLQSHLLGTRGGHGQERAQQPSARLLPMVIVSSMSMRRKSTSSTNLFSALSDDNNPTGTELLVEQLGLGWAAERAFSFVLSQLHYK